MRAARRLSLGLACALACALGIGVASAGADMQVYKSAFDGSGSSAGPFTHYAIGPIGIDQAAGTLYVRDRGSGGSYGGPSYPGHIDRFDLDGNPTKYPGTGSTSLPVPVGYYGGPGWNPDKLSIDNSGTATQGNILMSSEQAGVFGYTPDGLPINSNFPLKPPQYCGVTAAPDGGIWVNYFFNIFGYTSAGVSTGVSYPVRGCPGAFDTQGNLYVYSQFSGVEKYDGSNNLANLGEIGDTGAASAIAVDPTTDDVWVNHETYISAYHYSDPLVQSAPFEILTGFEESAGLAFDGDGNLYVSETGNSGDPSSTKVYIFHRQPASAPLIKRQSASTVRSTSAYLNAQVVSAGSDTTVKFEYGTDETYGSEVPELELGDRSTPFTPSFPISGLTPGTTYHYRVAATNASGTTLGPDRVFTTFATPPGGEDSCPNALARKQTGSRALLDCRAYELVSATNTGGSDVESSLVPGQAPYGGYPAAEGKALYAIHAGMVPGAGNATNRGPDPYLATRGADGWSTRYVGIPANINMLTDPFSSTLAEASAGLEAFAFGGGELCAPCFTDGVETGIPVHLPDGRLVQGMAGSIDPGPGAESEGHVGKRFSADGTQLVFGSSSKFEPEGNSGGEISIYARDLTTGTTRVVSKTPLGQTMTGAGIAELDLSDDGSRVIVAQQDSEDANGNSYWHPYMTIGDSGSSVDLAPGASEGVLYDGQTADGSSVFYTSKEGLLGADTDSSADIYGADVDPAGDVSLRLVTPGNDDACDPVPNADGDHWNSIGAGGNCDAVAIAGGGGVASASGDVYFLSPEQLDGSEGSANEPNLYLAPPQGGPQFVATLEPDNRLVRNALSAAGARELADFQVTPSGDDTVFTSKLPLTGADTAGNGEIFRYHAPDDQLDCPSCDPTGGESSGTGGDAFLAPDGLSLTDDGRVFFTTPGALVLNDSDGRLDVYEWAEGAPQLISSGISQFDSGLLSVSADGTDAFFFTHDALAAAEDENGTLTRIYDARAGGGFFAIPPPPPCKASDECHGAGTTAPGPPPIRSAVPARLGNVKAPEPKKKCRKHRVKRHGKCVKKRAKRKRAKRKRKHHAKRHRKGKRNHG